MEQENPAPKRVKDSESPASRKAKESEAPATKKTREAESASARRAREADPLAVPKRARRKKLAAYLTGEGILQIKARSKERAFEELAIWVAPEVPQFEPDDIKKALLEREEVANTWVAPGLAIPHARLPLDPGKFVIAVGRSPRGVEYAVGDKGPVHLMVAILAPDGEEEEFLSVLAAVAGIMKDEESREALMAAESLTQLTRVFSGKRAPKKRLRGRFLTRAEAVLGHARQLAAQTGCTAMFLFGDPIQNRLPDDWQDTEDFLILVSAMETPANIQHRLKGSIQLPVADLTRFGQLNLAILLALSRGLITSDDLVVYVTGIARSGTLDSVCLIDVDREYNIFFRPETHGILPPDLKPEVLEKVLHIAHGLAYEGREGKPVGAVFVLGDAPEVINRSRQLVLNPFRGYAEDDLNVLDPSLEETIKEFASIDGAFIIRGDGVLMAAGAYLKSGRAVKDLPSGLGARHQAAASITAATTALSIVISESTGKVTLFRNGQILLDIDRYRGTREGRSEK